MVSRIEELRRILDAQDDLDRDELSVRREHVRQEGLYHRLDSIKVFPCAPVCTSQGLQSFAERVTALLLPVKPLNVTRCYEYAETRRDVVKTASLYFTETISEPGEDEGLERRITVTVFPCRAMALDLGDRATIDLSHYECPEPCAEAKQCEFRAGSSGFFFDASRR